MIDLLSINPRTRWLRLSQAAEYVGLTPKTVVKHIREGHFRGRRLGRIWQVDRLSLDEPGEPEREIERLEIDAMERLGLQ